MNFALIYITNPSRKVAERVANYIIAKKLAACANIYGPIKSIYPWKGKIAREKEFVLILKTTKSNFEKVKREVEKIHPYTIPCIIKISVSSNKKYFDWIKSEVKN